MIKFEKPTLKEKLGDFAGNPYYKNAERLKVICNTDGQWDVGVGMAMLKAEDTETTYTLEEMKAFAELLREHPLDEVIAAKKELENTERK